jgi:putative tryptophan/tyrosine transport system substrate-binding protein
MKNLATLLLSMAVLGVSPASHAQEAPKVPRVGWLWTGPASPSSPYLEAFRQGMRALNYVEGQSYVLDAHYTAGKNELLPELVSALVRARADVIVAGPAPALLAAKEMTTTIPLVMTLGADPVSFGVAGGNVTGLTEIAPQLTSKRLELLKEIVPSLRRVAILWQPGSLQDETLKQTRTDTENEARPLGISVTVIEVREPGDFDAAFSAMATNQVDALIVLVSPMFNVQRKQIIDRAAAMGKPAIYEWKEFAQSGGFMSYGADLLDIYRRAASYVDKLIKGARPADLPVEHPTKFNLAINLKTAKALGLTIPTSLLARADEVIQ